MRADGNQYQTRLAELLRRDPMVSDVEVIPGSSPGKFTVLVVPQGFQPGAAMRELVMRLAGPAGERSRVVLTLAIPRDEAGNVDPAEVAAAASRPGAAFRFVPPVTEVERSLAELVQEVLTDVRVLSMTDSLAALGCDSVSAVEIVVRIRDRYGVDIDPHQVFGTGSLGELAAVLAHEQAGAVR